MTSPQDNHSMRAFFIIWIGQIFSLVGSRVVQFALPWWLTLQVAETSDNPATVLTAATIAALLPQIFIGPIAGALVDRWNRKRVMMIADGLVALVSLGLALLFWSGSAQIWHVFVVMFIRGLGGSFHWPAMQASTSLMVPKKHLGRVAGLNQVLNGALNIIGPALGALLLDLLGQMHWVMLVDVFTALLAIIPLFFVYVPQPAHTKAADGGEGQSVLADFRAGLRYVWRWPGVMGILIIAMVINMVVNPAFSLMPLLVKDYFGGMAGELAVIEGAWGVGMLLGGLILSVWGGFKKQIYTSLIGLAVQGLGIMMVGVTPPGLFVAAVSAVFVAGIMNPLVNGPFFAILQGSVAPEMQGRIFTLVGSMAAIVTPLGMAVAGPVADLIGVPAMYTIGGLVCTLMAVVAFFIPAIMNLEEHNREMPTAPAPALNAEPLGEAQP